ncbi:MAG: elongation factor G [Kiritimatiellae bacterium]|nr:elongation factor G [Kiritimatiellia bacterium]MDW8458639.1 elongation factor G [Verrucomicrobiota bacterium]
MKDVPVSQTRNIVFVGHTGSGKTTLIDALLFKLGASDRLGSPAAGTSAADWSDEEKERKITVWAKPFSVRYQAKDGKPVHFVFIDTPGYADFVGQQIAALAAADAALLVIDAASGIQVGTTRAWRRLEALGMPRGIVITGLDKENVDFKTTLSRIQDLWGRKCVPIELPTGDRHQIVDIIEGQIPSELKDDAEQAMSVLEEDAAEEDDALLEKYLGGEHLSHDELVGGLRVAIRRGHLVPVFEAEPLQGIGISELLEELYHLFPSPLEIERKDAEGRGIDPSPEAPLAAQVWRTVNDPYVGQMSFLRIFGGTLKSDSELFNVNKGQKERIGFVHVVNGKKDVSVTEAHAGDIVALPKLKVTQTGDTLTSPGQVFRLPSIEFPQPVMSVAVVPKTSGDDDKIGIGLQRIAEEDPTLKVERNMETKELILAGMGDIHLDIAVSRMKKRSNVDVTLSTPKVAYRETITARAEGHYKHKKQTGGRGQYGEVYIRLEPMAPGETEWFVDALVGTNVPRNFLPAIQKGLLEGMSRGVLAGAPVVNTKITIYDGSHHEVDSSEISFKIAAARAFTDGMLKAKPVLLEPIMNVKITVPDRYMGDVTGDLNHKRGRILNVSAEGGFQIIEAEIPQAEMFRYSAELRSLTRGEGSFEASFARYDVVPTHIAQKVIAEAQKNKQAEAEE